MQIQTKISELRNNPDFDIAYSFNFIGPEKLYHFYEISLNIENQRNSSQALYNLS